MDQSNEFPQTSTSDTRSRERGEALSLPQGKEAPLSPLDPGFASAFTLIEMLVVLAVIGLVAAIVIPRVASLASVELRSAARDLAGTIHLVYSTAAVKRLPYRLAFDLAKQEYSIEEKAGDQYVPVTDPLLQPRVLPESVAIQSIQVLDRVCEGPGQEYLYFTPEGYVEEAAIYIGTADGEQVYSIFTRPMTGRAVIVPEKISRQQWERSEEGK